MNIEYSTIKLNSVETNYINDQQLITSGVYIICTDTMSGQIVIDNKCNAFSHYWL